MKSLQVENLANIIIPIPPKVLGSQYYGDDSEFIYARQIGIQKYLDYLISHHILCGSENLKMFLTGQNDEYEQLKQEKSQLVSKDPLNVMLSNVLSDGSAQIQRIEKGSSSSKAVSAVKSTVTGIYNVGGYFAGALMSGATMIGGSGQDTLNDSQQDLVIDGMGQVG